MDEMLTVKEAASLLRVSVRTIYRMAQRGVITIISISGAGSTRIHARSLHELMTNYDKQRQNMSMCDRPLD